MLHELRIYETMPGKLPALNDRFANHTTGFFKNHGIGMLGFWTDEIGDSNKLTYILSFDSMADREQKMTAFQADRAWQEVRAETEQDGPFVARVLNTFLQLTPYSPEPKVSTNLQELRTYEAVPGNLPALNDRFANHTSALFEKHGVAFVSVTQQFSTANSMGKLVLNILMSFSEFERDMISERIRDKAQATRRRGMWTGGRPILGYDVVDKKLVVSEDEAQQVRGTFELYLERGSLREAEAEVELARSIAQPGLVAYRQATSDPVTGKPCVIMELCSGIDLTGRAGIGRGG